jgi:hypothetical protein
MTLSPTRAGISSIAGAALLSFALIGSTAAQVATLAEPDPNAQETAAPVSEDLDGQEAILDWAQCMRDNDIDMDDPRFGIDGGRLGFGPGGADAEFDPLSPEFQAAMETCGNVLEALRPEADPEEVAERAEQQLVIAECMRGLGWDLPDPAAGGGFGAQIRYIQEAGIDPQDPAFQADITACQAESGLELGPPGAGGGVAG